MPSEKACAEPLTAPTVRSMGDPISLPVEGGYLTIAADGIRHEPITMYGEPRVEHWPWARVSHLAFEDGGRHADQMSLAMLGVFGFLFRRRRSLAILSTTAGDVSLVVQANVPALRAAARRIVASTPEAAGKISVTGQTF